MVNLAFYQITNINEAQQIAAYLSLIGKRAKGDLLTNASWIRKFVKEHPVYKHDSEVSDEVRRHNCLPRFKLT